MKGLFSRLLRNIMEMDVFVFDENSIDLSSFENLKNHNNFSFDFSEDYLKIFLAKLENNFYYELIDNLKQRLFIFKFEGFIYLIGPYLKRFADENEIAKIGMSNHIPLSMMESLKIQYFALPIIDSYHLEKVINSILNSLYENKYFSYAYKKIDHYKEGNSYVQEIIENSSAEKAIYDKYEIENTLLYHVEHGQVEEIKTSLSHITTVRKEDYLVNFYSSNPQAAMASYRTLLRKSAEKSGLSVTIIDKVISKYTQLMLSSPNDQFQSLISLAIELTTEVRNFLINTKCKSPLIKNVCEYLYINSSKNISILDLSKKYSVNEFYLAHLFKNETGQGIHEYIERIRINKAEQMLKDSTLTISEIANLVGYVDNNYFTKVFKKRNKITPSKYRMSNAK